MIMEYDYGPTRELIERQTQLDARLMKVVGGVSRQRVPVPILEEIVVTGEDGKPFLNDKKQPMKEKAIVGYEVREIPNEFTETIDEDSTLANLKPNASSIVRQLLTGNNFTQISSEMTKFKLPLLQKFTAHEIKGILAISRGEDGWNGRLIKSMYSITTEDKKETIKELKDKKKSWWRPF